MTQSAPSANLQRMINEGGVVNMTNDRAICQRDLDILEDLVLKSLIKFSRKKTAPQCCAQPYPLVWSMKQA